MGRTGVGNLGFIASGKGDRMGVAARRRVAKTHVGPFSDPLLSAYGLHGMGRSFFILRAAS